MIIFGYRAFVKTLAMLTFICQRCGNPAAQRLQQRSRWFTLFFIPVVPMGFTRFTTCTFCGASTKVTKEQAQQMIDASQATQVPAYGQHAPIPQHTEPGQWGQQPYGTPDSPQAPHQ